MSIPAPDRILQTGLAFWSSKVLLSALELDLFTELAKAPANLNALTERLKLHPRGAQDFLDALVSMGFLERHEGQYQNTEETALFLNRDHPSYIGSILELANHHLYPVWGRLTDAIKSGKPQHDFADGNEDVYSILYEDDDKLAQFISAMSGVSKTSNGCIARQFPWSHFKTFADIGTAEGDLAIQVALSHPHLTGVGFDLERIARFFNHNVSQHALSDRLHYVSGDFFVDPLPRADVILMGHILHGWDMGKKQFLIKKAFEALPEGGALVVYESLIDDDRRENTHGLLMSLNMLVETQGGFDFTGADCCSWLEAAGFSGTRIEHLQGADSMVIAIK
ncbi:methyltransferase [Kistimonas scapharcae]|uniref:Methyltransferase n=1 Tax=Kistimonas scapharcae TaxID=1036133 RepID=A0ABP8V410_9GAMM